MISKLSYRTLDVLICTLGLASGGYGKPSPHANAPDRASVTSEETPILAVAQTTSLPEQLSGTTLLAGGLWLFIALLLVPQAGCQSGIGAPCESDADCGSREICARDQCTRRCSNDTDCPEARGFTCQPYLPSDAEDPLNVCLPESGPDTGDTSNPNACTTDRECEIRYDAGRARCGLDGECLLAPLRFAARIVDTTADPLPSDGSPGADIAAVIVVEPGGGTSGLEPSQIVAVGRTVDYNPVGEGMSAGNLDGSVPEIRNGGRCTSAENAKAVTSLGGDGGSILVEFQRRDGGTRIEGFGQLELVVIEWDDNCGATTDASDQFRIELCLTAESTWDPESDCGLEVGEPPFSGYTHFAIPDRSR